MLRRKSRDNLKAWLDRAARSLVASFANGIIGDRGAVQNAITSIWSNGQTEGPDHEAETHQASDERRDADRGVDVITITHLHIVFWISGRPFQSSLWNLVL